MIVDSQVAAVACGVTPRTIQRWVLVGRLTNWGSGRRVRVELEDLLGDRPSDVAYGVPESKN